MKANKIIAIILFIVGELLIVSGFLTFFGYLENKILVLDILVVSIILIFLLVDIFNPLIDIKSSSHEKVASLGLRWFFLFAYSVLAIAGMTLFAVDFKYQFMIQAILFFLLMMGIFIAISAAQHAGDDYYSEKQIRSSIEEIRVETKKIKLTIEEMKNVPETIAAKINTLYDELKFVPMSNNPTCVDLDNKYLAGIKSVSDFLNSFPVNFDKITEIIENCQRTLNERKNNLSI